MSRAWRLAAALLGACLVLSASAARADIGWPQRAGGAGFDWATAVTVDAAGYVYVVGQFAGTASFGGTTLTSAGSQDMFVGKLDAGGAWQWVVRGGGSADEGAQAIAVDSSGNVYVTGYYASAAAQFGNIALPAANGYDVYVAKLDATGNWVWANSANGPDWDFGLAIAVNDDREVFVAGQFRLGLAFGSVPSLSTALPIQGGACLWHAPGDDDYCTTGLFGCGPCPRGGGDCNNDGDCNAGLVCRTRGAEFGLPSNYNFCVRPDEPANADAFVAKLSAGGSWSWALAGGGKYFGTDTATGIVVKKIPIGPTSVTPRNVIYLSGSFQGEEFTLKARRANGTIVPSPALSAPTLMRDVFVVKLVEELGSMLPDIGQATQDPNPAVVWVKDGVNPAAGDELWANALAMDADGFLYVGGGYKGTPRLTASSLYPAGTRTGGFTARLVDNDLSASWNWAKALQDSATGGDAEVLSVAVDSQSIGSRGVFAAGHFNVGLYYSTFGSAAEPHLASAGGWDVFAARYEAGDGRLDPPNAAGDFTNGWIARGGLSNNDYLERNGGHAGTALVRGGIAVDQAGTSFLVGSFEKATRLIEGPVMSFDGSGQYVAVAAAASETDYAVSLWFKTTERGQGIYSVFAGAPNSSFDRTIYLDGSGNLAARVWSDETIRTTGSDLADGQWHHVVHTFGTVAGGQKLYVDGVERAAGLRTFSNFNWDTSYAIGYATDATKPSFTGKIASVELFSPGLTPGEVWSIFADPANLPGDGGGKILFAAGNRDTFLASLGPDGAWRESETWVVGQKVPRPDGALAIRPEIASPPNGDQYFYWSDSDKELYSVWASGGVIKWRVLPNLDDMTHRIVTVGAADWPAKPQLHVAGVPVELQPSSTTFSYAGIHRTQGTTGANDTLTTASGGQIFRATGAGYSVLRYGVGGPDLTVFPPSFEIVKTIPWDSADHLQDGQACTIGQRLTDPAHTDPLGKNGYVIFANAYYDGFGSSRAYDRETRTGPIIPVNKLGAYNQNTSATAESAGRDLVVAWFRTNDKNVPWPVRPVRYNCQWPANPLKIVIASQLGSDVYNQPVLDPAVFPLARVYRQNDPAQPGYNPNEEHAALFPSATGTGFDAAFALRNDLAVAGDPSLPYVLLKYQSPADGKWAMLVYRVYDKDTQYNSFTFQGTAGTPIFPPYPVRLLAGCPQSYGAGDPYWQDRVNNQYWAKSQGLVTVYYHYPILIEYDYPANPSLPRQFNGQPGDCVGWLDRAAGNGGQPVPVVYDIRWPADVPVLQVGETLLHAKRGLPEIVNQAATEVVYDQIDPRESDPALSLVQLIDPLSPRSVALAEIPTGVATTSQNGKQYFDALPFHLAQRVSYDPRNRLLSFAGSANYQGLGDPLLLLNVLSGSERDELLALSTNTAWGTAVTALFYLTRNPQRLDLDSNGIPDKIEAGQQPLLGLQDKYTKDANGVIVDEAPDGVPEPLEALGSGFALTAGAATGTGYVTLAFNNDPSLGALPVSLKVIRVECGPYLGEIKVIQSPNVFDEKLTLRHSGDFGGNPENFTFEWYYHPDQGGYSPTPLPSPETSQLNGWLPYPVGTGAGANAVTIQGASLQTLSDNWFYVRYRGYPTCGNTVTPTPWAGAPGSSAAHPSAQLAEGWIKRVVRALNAYEARVKDFHLAPTASYASMILQAGERYEGDVAMNNDPDNLNTMGLIAAYETVLRRGMSLSIDGTPPIDYAPANAALLLAASRISDFYALLGNEAYADAADPTIGFGTESGEYGSAAASIFAFQNQLDSLLEEELTLLRGRDYTAARPIYNRLVWNFTSGEGEVAYAQVYGMSDQNADGVIDEYDGRVLFPQGHGDAWGHYLTGLTTYYKLLRHRFYSWEPRAEAVLVAGAPVMVDYLDERKFAKAAAAKARAGAEIVDLTYRQSYVEAPEGQWQGYTDTDPARQWGLAEWGRRAGQGAYFDWVVGNAILPAVDTNPAHVNRIQKIDRTTVLDLAEMRTQYTTIQAQLDKADAGLSPLGLARGVVPFDIDPVQIRAGKTHFEQVYDRAEAALQNAVTVFNWANRASQSLRRNQDSLDDFALNLADQEWDYANRLIGIFGYPYAGDIGPAGSYPNGYDGPDILHYMWVDAGDLTGASAPPVATDSEGNAIDSSIAVTFDLAINDSNAIQESFTKTWGLTGAVTYNFTPDGLGIEKPANAGVRRAQGELQRALSDVYRARASFQQALRGYDNIVADIQSKAGDLQMADDLNTASLTIVNNKNKEQKNFNIALGVMKGATTALQAAAKIVDEIFQDTAECPPKSLGFSIDATSGIRCVLEVSGTVAGLVLETIADAIDIAANATELAKEDAANAKDYDLMRSEAAYAVSGAFGDLEALIREEPLRRLEAYLLKEELTQSVERYFSVLAEGERLIEELASVRSVAAAEVQKYRYQDMTFRVFRNDAIQKYRAQFDLAARYTYLAAAAYDYETNQVASAGSSGRKFMNDIVRERNLGQVIAGRPIAGTPGLADPLARLRLNFDVLKGQLGFNNPQNETSRFSLRSELLRIDPGPAGDAGWLDALGGFRVENLWDLEEFRRYCRPFSQLPTDPADPTQWEPGIVIPFGTTVTFGRNFFGRPLGGGDSSYDPANFATKVRAAGVWFSGYAGAGLSSTPRVYLVPVGLDVLRAPTSGDFHTREWKVVDQKLPVPFPIGQADLTDPAWIPVNDSLADMLGGVRRFASFRAYHDSGGIVPTELATDSRLVGRSVWNTGWLLIIPGGTLHYDRAFGLDTFVNGVSDIKLTFQTYGYSGD